MSESLDILERPELGARTRVELGATCPR
jgi:hypothetical protein